MNKLMYRFVTTRKKKKEIDPFLDTVCPFRASRVINVPICSYEEEKKKEIDPFLDTACLLRASRVKRNRPVFRHGMPPQGIPRNCRDKIEIAVTKLKLPW